MAQNVTAIRKGLASGLIPDTVLKQIDDQEVLDRLARAGKLNQEADATSGTARRDLLQQARAVMQAQPRAVTEREVQAAVAKASGLGNGHQADALRRRANELLEQHPPAPRRQAARAARPVPVAKAGRARKPPVRLVYDRAGRMCCVDPARISQQIAKAASGADDKPKPLAVYDVKGNLIGITDPDGITYVQGGEAPAASEAKPAQPAVPAAAPGQPASQDQVAKATRRPARPVPATVMFDAGRNMVGIVRGTEFTPCPPSTAKASRPAARR
jgi:hypothetical protein